MMIRCYWRTDVSTWPISGMERCLAICTLLREISRHMADRLVIYDYRPGLRIPV